MVTLVEVFGSNTYNTTTNYQPLLQLPINYYQLIRISIPTSPMPRPSERCLSLNDVCLLIVEHLDVGDRLRLEAVSRVWRDVVSIGWSSCRKTYLSYRSRRSCGGLKGLVVRAHHNETSASARILVIGNAFDAKLKENVCLEVIGDEVEGRSQGSLASYTFAMGTSGVDCPPGGAFASTVDVDGNLLLFGGWDDQADEVISQSYRGSTSRRMDWKAYTDHSLWERLPGVSFPRCFGAATSSTRGNVFLIGGADSPYRGAGVYDDATAFSASDQGFAHSIALPRLAERRCGHAAVTLFDDSVVVMGGYAGGLDYLSSVERLDMGAQKWLRLPSMVVPRSGFASAVGEGGAVYVAGGSPDGSHGHSSLERLDLRVGRWESLPSMHYRRGYTAGCIGNRGCLYVSGGINYSTRQASLEIFDPRMNVWRSGSSIYRDDKLARAAHTMVFVWR